MLRWIDKLFNRAPAGQKFVISRRTPEGGAIPELMWEDTLAQFPFLARRSIADQRALLDMTEEFLERKEFTGARGLMITDEMAIAIAAQACLPVLHLGLKYYDDFRGIVVHPGPMLARREVTDDAGVVHRYSEALTGEAMEYGPVTLSWADVAASGDSAAEGYNVVIHEFVHKIDMRDGAADGCPPMPTRAARAAWEDVFEPAYDAFCEKVAMAQRFGGEPTWLDPYAAHSPAEFFAVASEAYFVNRDRFAADFVLLTRLFDRFFIPD